MDRFFSTEEVAKIIGVGVNTLSWWVRPGYITPSIKKAKGKGSRNLFSLADVYQCAFFKHLLALKLVKEEAAGYDTISGGLTTLVSPRGSY